jgi:beta-galactosidase
MKNCTNRLLLLLALVGSINALLAQEKFQIPVNNRVVYNLNYDWKFNKADATNSHTVAFNDAGWKAVSLPHTYNDIDLFDTWVTGSGNYGWAGKTWYRKKFKLNSTFAGRRVWLSLKASDKRVSFL